MKSLSLNRPVTELDSALDEVVAMKPSIVMIFAAPSFFENEDAQQKVKERLAEIPLIGTSTAGEIVPQGVLKDTVTFFAIRFERSVVKTVAFPLKDCTKSKQAGQNIGEALRAADLRAVILFAPGMGTNGSALVEGLSSQLDSHVLVTGGLAADEMNFMRTHTMYGNGESVEVYVDHAVAVGFYGDSLVVGCGSEGGWRPFGPARRVTKAYHNILYEIDGKPALRLYQQYLGEKARQLPASGLPYPFAVLREDRTISGIIRTALAIDHEKEALILAGDMPENARVCLMHADTGALTQGAAQAAAEALRTHGGAEENGFALVVSCVGRRAIYGIDAEEEIEAIEDSFLPQTPFAGFYSYGEICSYRKTGEIKFHNQTMCVTYFTEKDASGE